MWHDSKKPNGKTRKLQKLVRLFFVSICILYCGGDGKKNRVGVAFCRSLGRSDLKEGKRQNNSRESSVGESDSERYQCAPRVGCEAAVKEKFWLDLDAVMRSISEYGEFLIGGDFNGHIRQDR